MRRLLALVAKVAISAALLYVAFARVDLSTIGSRLQQAKAPWLIAMMLALLGQLFFISLRWREIGQQCGVNFSVAQTLRTMFIASFFNQTLPSTIGGDAARIWFAARSGAGWKAATYSVVIDRIVGLSVLVAIIVVCLPWLIDLVRDPIGRTSMLLVNGAGIAGVAAFLFLGRARWPWLERRWLTRHVTGIAATAFEILNNRSSLGKVAGYSLCVHVLTITAVWCAALAVGAPLEYGYAILLVPPVLLVTTVPISIAGWGVREGAMMAVFTYAGLLEADGLVVSVIFGAGLFAIGLVGGAIWILSPDRKAWTGPETSRLD